MEGCPVINGIAVHFDAYASGDGSTYDIKLTWNLGSSWTSAQTSGVLPVVDSDTYLTVGGSSELWGRSWSKTDFASDSFGIYFKCNTNYRTYYCDHIEVKVYYTSVSPAQTQVSIFNRAGYCNQSVWTFSTGSGADSKLVKILGSTYPTLSTGTQIYNGSANYFYCDYDVLSMYYDYTYFVSVWSWNSTYCLYSTVYHTVWITPCNHKLTLYENIINATGYHNSTYSSYNGWKVWANYTGNDTGGSGCDQQYFNYSDENITINITYWGCNNTNTSNYGINEDNWLFYNGFSLEAGELGLFFVFIIFTLAFAINPEDRNIMRPILLFMDVPVSLATGIFYLGNTVNSIMWWIGIFMFLFAVLLGLAGLYYSLMFGRGKK